MNDNNSRGLESPDCADESTINCPYCDTSIFAVVTRGPSTHVLSPCGCPVGTLTARNFAEGDTSTESSAVSTDEDPTSTFTLVSKTHLIGGRSSPEAMTPTTTKQRGENR
ncbi:hypothetical protein [Haladaptatus cibarius]|uniref:hypothetical protein n=1 Tax=Haladaptatus cibarius TaxID=453847 RepID=UPI0009FCF9B4|nr:hypothetical protein [Haladaptatus cibarius]